MRTTLKPLDIQNELHLKMMYEVRAHPDVASMLSSSPPKDYEQHVHYLTKIASGKVFFIIMANQVACGYCQMTIKENEVELGWAIHPEWWGKKIGSASVALLVEHVKKKYSPRIYQICLLVKKNNLAAIHIYKKNGFFIHSSDDLKNEYLMCLSKN